jgi:hypothetical protein
MRYLIFTTPRTASQYVEHLLFPALQEAYGYEGMLSEAFSPSRCLVETNGVLCSASLNEEKREKGSLVNLEEIPENERMVSPADRIQRLEDDFKDGKTYLFRVMASHVTEESLNYLSDTHTFICLERRDKLSQGLSQAIAKEAKRWGHAAHDFAPGSVTYRRESFDAFMADLTQYREIVSQVKNKVTVFSEDLTASPDEFFKTLGLTAPPQPAAKDFKNSYTIDPIDMISNRDEVLEWFESAAI